jgi:DNA-binding GntR family transcriptional regulator
MNPIEAHMETPDTHPNAALTSREIVAILEQDIVYGRLNPRERLIEDDLRERFNATRHAVRQALASLKEMGLVDYKKNYGSSVRSYSVEEVLNIYRVRCILESNAVYEINFPVGEDRLVELENIQRRHDASIKIGDMRKVFEANVAFHRYFFSLVDNPVLASEIEYFANRVHAIRFISAANPDYLERSRQDHWELTKALRKQDSKQLAKLCEQHILPSRDMYLAHLSESPWKIVTQKSGAIR